MLHFSLDLGSWHSLSYSEAPETKIWWKILGMRLRQRKRVRPRMVSDILLQKMCIEASCRVNSSKPAPALCQRGRSRLLGVQAGHWGLGL